MNLNVLKGFKSSEIKRWAQTHLTPGSTVYSDGLNCFPAVKEADCKHVPIVTGGGAASVDKIEFIWVNTMISSISLSVNLSGKAMDNPEISVLIRSLLKEHDVEPSRLIIEVTETAAVSDIVGAERLMYEIKDLGCHFALDDFGVGFSSFFYLKQLPVDYVKLDGMFIRQLPYSDEDQVFVKALNEMAHGLGKQTVAEFVESQDILDMLVKYDVDYAQGYFIGKPLPDILRQNEEA